MKQPDKLFQLIKSLNKSEKRQFKLHVSRYSTGSETNHAKLFDAIDQLEEYDEAVLKSRFKGSKLIKSLPVIKSYLYNIIMESLRQGKDKMSVEAQLKDLLSDIEILHNKTLYHHCYPLLSKARTIAEQNQKHLALLEIFEWEQKVRMREAPLKELEKHLEESFGEEQKVIEIYENRCDLKFLARKMLLLSRKIQVIQTPEDLNPFNEIISHPLFKDEKAPKSIIAHFDFLNSWALYYRIANEPEKQIEMRKKGVELIDENPEYRDHNPEAVFIALNNLIYAYINSGRYEEAEHLLPRLYAMQPYSEDLFNLVHSSARNLELAICFHQAKYDKGVGLLEKFEKEIGPLENKMIPNQKSAYFFYNSLLYFGAGNYKKSLSWLRRVMDVKEDGYRLDVHRFAMILNLLVHYELGHHEQLEHYVKSTYRAFYKQKTVYKTETLVFNFLKRLASIKGMAKFRELLGEFHEKLTPLLGDPFEKRMLDYIDLPSWVESKLTEVPFQEVTRRKAVE